MISTLLTVLDYLPTLIVTGCAIAAIVVLPPPLNLRAALAAGVVALTVFAWTAGKHSGEETCAAKLAAVQKAADDETARRASVLSTIQVTQNRRDAELHALEEAIRRQQKEHDDASRANDRKPCFDADSMRRLNAAGSRGKAR